MYMQRAIFKYGVVFSQWRALNDSVDMKLLKYNCEQFNNHYFSEIHLTKQPLEKTIDLSTFSLDFEIAYGFSFENKKNKKMQPWRINTFWSLGLADPFPDETTIMEKEKALDGEKQFTLEERIYPDSRYDPKEVPLMIYLPSRIMMWKMIRSCMGCKNVSELWFNQKS